MYGEPELLWIAERIGTLALTGDAAGVQRFREIASRFELLLTGQRPKLPARTPGQAA